MNYTTAQLNLLQQGINDKLLYLDEDNYIHEHYSTIKDTIIDFVTTILKINNDTDEFESVVDELDSFVDYPSFWSIKIKGAK